MKESVTKFDFESAFKALDEIETPKTESGVKANRPALTEIFSRKSKFDALFEEYYDVSDTTELGEAQEAREAEIAKAKLERIEKIVDLDAESPEDLLTSYVGKYIIQCPQCMTLFYKDKEDVVESEDDPTTVNVSEVCQHCGNESGYTLVGKVGEAEAEDPAEVSADEAAEDISLDIGVEEEETSEETEPALDDIELDELDLNIEDDETGDEEKTEEAFVAHTGETLVEDVQDDKELDAKLDAHNEYIEYLRTVLAQEEDALEKTDNEQVKAAIQRRIDALKADLDAALPEAVKNDEAVVEEPIEVAEEEAAIEEPTEEVAEEEPVAESLTEALQEEADFEVSDEEFEKLINSPEFKKPISDSAVRAMMNAEESSDEESVKENLDNEALEEGIGDVLKGIGDGLKLTRAGKADWLLKNTPIDYNKIKLDDKGKLIVDTPRFSTYLVLGYANTVEGQPIKEVPAQDAKLIPEMDEPLAVNTFREAVAQAEVWSKHQDDNGVTKGPADIFLAQNKEGDGAVFLCRYFKGKAYNDNIEKYFNIVSNNIAGAKKIYKKPESESEAAEVEAEAPAEASNKINTKKIKVSELKVGQKLKVNNKIGTVISIEEITIMGVNYKKIKIEYANKQSESKKYRATDPVEVVIEEEAGVTAEAFKHNNKLATIMEQLNELQESSLEQLISSSLVETYGNVAEYRLTSCEYLDEKLRIHGTIHFTSGNTRKTTYTFSEAFVEDDKVKLCGLNEKLGLDKKFTLIGRTENKTLITESFGNK